MKPAETQRAMDFGEPNPAPEQEHDVPEVEETMSTASAFRRLHVRQLHKRKQEGEMVQTDMTMLPAKLIDEERARKARTKQRFNLREAKE